MLRDPMLPRPVSVHAKDTYAALAVLNALGVCMLRYIRDEQCSGAVPPDAKGQHVNTFLVRTGGNDLAGASKNASAAGRKTAKDR